MLKTSLLLTLIVIFIAASGFILSNKELADSVKLPFLSSSCTEDVKICDDGASVSRVLPNCEFAACPVLEGKPIIISGSIICLPHKRPDAVNTLECAYGLKGEDGNNYGLTDPNWKFLTEVGTGANVEINGKFIKQDDGKYNSIGKIEIENMEKLD